MSPFYTPLVPKYVVAAIPPALFAFGAERYIAKLPVGRLFSAAAIAAIVVGGALIPDSPRWAAAAWEFAFAILWLKVLFALFERRLGQEPTNAIHKHREPGDLPDRIFTGFYVIGVILAYVGLLVLTSFLSRRL
jgi:hypothetical protein